MQHYIGVDLHKAFVHACAVNALGERCWEDRFPATADGVAAFVGRCDRARAVAVEASGPTWRFADHVADRVPQVCIVDPGRTRLKAGYVAKMDRLDARRLADALRRDSVVSICYTPVAIRELRELCHYPGSLARIQAVLKQWVHAVLTRQGITMPPLSDVFGQAGMRWLTSVVLTDRAAQAQRGRLHMQLDLGNDVVPLHGTSFAAG